jgi:hypothetical protein
MDSNLNRSFLTGLAGFTGFFLFLIFQKKMRKLNPTSSENKS